MCYLESKWQHHRFELMWVKKLFFLIHLIHPSLYIHSSIGGIALKLHSFLVCNVTVLDKNIYRSITDILHYIIQLIQYDISVSVYKMTCHVSLFRKEGRSLAPPNVTFGIVIARRGVFGHLNGNRVCGPWTGRIWGQWHDGARRDAMVLAKYGGIRRGQACGDHECAWISSWIGNDCCKSDVREIPGWVTAGAPVFVHMLYAFDHRTHPAANKNCTHKTANHNCSYKSSAQNITACK